ncbi:hypothetical protein [Psychroflexus salis]|uniref:Uncharacterized protein n=1 Tax=Psychroflexus salis TaxID=1526574 RepID=A0A917E962_9FLAO|nr:hypothetical protein [Psychroflexus salis]GGE15528.1 hypothetical protein GCM10010831_16060 [Psychroflexus salis]
MNFDNPFLYNSCFYIRLNNISKKVFEQFKLISIQVLDAERNDDKMIVVENQYREEGGYEYMYLFFEESKSLSYIYELELIGAIDFYEDVTVDLISGRLDNNEDFRQAYFGNLDPNPNITKESEFTHLFNFFLLKNRTQDHVMDRIISLGIDNIWEIDREILNQSTC